MLKLITAILCAISSVTIFGWVTDCPGTANYMRCDMTIEIALGITASITLMVVAMSSFAGVGGDEDAD